MVLKSPFLIQKKLKKNITHDFILLTNVSRTILDVFWYLVV